MTASWRSLLGGIAAAGLVLAFVGGVPTPASASVSQGVVAGTGAVNDDWGDEGVVDRNTRPNTGATGLWQLVLYADGAIERDGSTFDLDDVDCEFGPNTQAATRNWQSTHNINADGSAGPQTFGTADANLSTPDGGTTVNYNGRAHTVTFFRTIGGGAAVQGAYVVPNFDFDFAYYDRKPADCF